MRKFSRAMIGLLLGATVLAPIAAQAQERDRDRGGEGRWRGGPAGESRGGESRGDGMSREAIQQAREANRAVERPAPVPQARVERPADSVRQGRGESDARRDRNRSGDTVQAGVTRNDDNRRRDGSRGDNDNRRGDANRGDDHRGRDWNRGDNDRNQRWTGDRRDWNREGNRAWDGDRRSWDRRDGNRRDNDRWDRNWRNDRRYSWQDYRTRNRDIYNLPRYQARHGYNYRRLYSGFRFESVFYGSSYWISDPWSYRLPPAYGPYRWVRYFDDVALVDLRTGEIVDIIYSFFW